MPYEFKAEDGGARVKFHGIFCNKDNTDATIELHSHSHFCGLDYIIWDFSDVTEMDMTEDETNVASMMDKVASKRLLHTNVALITKDTFTRKLCEGYIAQC